MLAAKLAQNIDPLTPKHLAKLAIESARKLIDGCDGISYLMNSSMHGIETPLSAAYASEIVRELGFTDLTQALKAAHRKKRKTD